MSFITTCTASGSSQISQTDLIDIRKQCVCPPENVTQTFSSYTDRSRSIRQISSEVCCPKSILAAGSSGILDVSGISGELVQLIGGIPVNQPAIFQVLADNETVINIGDTLYKVKPTEPYKVSNLLNEIVKTLELPDFIWD